MKPKAQYTKTTHAAGVAKMRCGGCKVGMAELQQQPDGSQAYVCPRCGRKFKETRM